MSFIFTYLKQRINLIQLFVLSVLLVLLVSFSYTENDIPEQVTFLFLSFLVFRVLDDLGSVHYDRIHHPDRLYLNPDVFEKMIGLCALCILVYLGFCYYFSLKIGVVLTVFIAFSVGLYLLFGRAKFLAIIPLLKYPVLLWCSFGFTTDLSSVLLIISSSLILGVHDMIEKITDEPKLFILSLSLLLVIGLLVFEPYHNWYYSVLVLIPLGVAYALRSYSKLKYFPLLYFPLVHLIMIA